MTAMYSQKVVEMAVVDSQALTGTNIIVHILGETDIQDMLGFHGHTLLHICIANYV